MVTEKAVLRFPSQLGYQISKSDVTIIPYDLINQEKKQAK